MALLYIFGSLLPIQVSLEVVSTFTCFMSYAFLNLAGGPNRSHALCHLKLCGRSVEGETMKFTPFGGLSSAIAKSGRVRRGCFQGCKAYSATLGRCNLKRIWAI